MPVTCSALGDLHIYTKQYKPTINIIISGLTCLHSLSHLSLVLYRSYALINYGNLVCCNCSVVSLIINSCEKYTQILAWAKYFGQRNILRVSSVFPTTSISAGRSVLEEILLRLYIIFTRHCILYSDLVVSHIVCISEPSGRSLDPFILLAEHVGVLYPIRIRALAWSTVTKL